MPAWNDWFHVTGSTYGTWLPGDPRGFRTRHHREHVEGDYRAPPPEGLYDKRHEHAKQLMTRDPVILTPEARDLACTTFAEAFTFKSASFGAIAIGARHYHILLQAGDPRSLVGIAKKRSARALSDAGLVPRGGVWAVRSRSLPISDADHWSNTRAYILRHARDGAATRAGTLTPHLQ